MPKPKVNKRRISPYFAVAIQANYVVVNDRKQIAPKVLPRYLDLIDHAIEWYGLFGERVGNPPVKLITFPEFAFQGWDYYHAPTFASPAKGKYGSQKLGLKVAVEMPGKETEILGRKAKEHKIYIAAASLEYDPDWPGRFFNTAFIIGANGKVIHKYRKVNTTNHGIGVSTSPYDILDKYMERYGNGKSIAETLFPVTDTEIGMIGTYTCWDGQFPEVPRALTLNGAEILIRAIQAYTGNLPGGPKAFRMNNQMRAIENCAYVISTNSGRTLNQPRFPTKVPEQWSCGHSMVVDHFGNVLAEAGEFGEEVVGAGIDVEGLRKRRSSPNRNLPAQLLTELYADVYARLSRKKLGVRPNEPKETIQDNLTCVSRAIDRFYQEGIYKMPSR